MSEAQPPVTPSAVAGGRFNHAISRTASRTSLMSKPASTVKAGDTKQRNAVNVAVRIRPPPPPNDPTIASVPPRFRASRAHVTDQATLAIDTANGTKQFTFDRVFSDSESQDGVWNYVSEAVNAFTQGYNVSILAYGQSGAGKSYTMGTLDPEFQGDTADMGIIPRASAALFKNLPVDSAQIDGDGTAPFTPRMPGSPSSPSSTKTDEPIWQLKATYVEIYNEQLRDLLVSDSTPQNERPSISIREDAKGRILIAGAKELNINSAGDLLEALNFGSSIRQTDSTAINAKSSRSHAVFTLNLVQRRSKPGNNPITSSSTSRDVAAENSIVIDSKLNFVDLAGSERLKNTGSVGERIKEGIAINAGLASLGKVISQLSSRAPGAHVSYRDSRLTRLLQDSLGGTAITYMIACVNPVEFHLSETLNTVQYAQRARAIQSKPRIQQRTQESEKQLVIDRLRSEIAYLRDQLRLSEQNGRRISSHQDRTGRKQARENELQNQLLDAQENYSALSHRFAKLISEMSRDRNGELQDMPLLKRALKNDGRTKLDLSSANFASTVEDIIMDYEKTIQMLESSLSGTRASLATTESSLLEREAKIVYLEAVAQQLQGRIQRSSEREADTEAYVRELEAKLDGLSTGEDHHRVVIQDLRDELTRVRESEASAEDYIATLEERLAEAEQDLELMQREISRLEHIVQRQRTIGKLDNLVADLDRDNVEEESNVNGAPAATSKEVDIDVFHDRLIATTSAVHPNEEMHPDMAEDEWKSFGPMDGQDQIADTAKPRTPNSQTVPRKPIPSAKEHPAHTKAVADKMETMAIELFELKVDHESTVAELEDVTQRLQTALGTIADLQQVFAEIRQPKRTSFLDTTALHNDGLHPPSRVLSSDLSSLGDTPTLVEASDADTSISDRVDYGHQSRTLQTDDSLAEAIRALMRANAEKDISISELTENYAQLQDQHNDTLNYIEELKEEVVKGKDPHADSAESVENEDTTIIPSTLVTIKAELANGKTRLFQLYEGHATQEKELSTKLQSFKASLARHAEFLATLPQSTATDGPDTTASNKPLDLAGLENEITVFQLQQDTSSESVQALEKQLLQAVSNIENILQDVEIKTSAATVKPEAERTRQLKQVEVLQKQLDAQNKKLAHYEQNEQKGINGSASSPRQSGVAGLAELEDQLDQQKSLVMFHQQGLKSMQESHARELEQLQRTHDQALSTLRDELSRAQTERSFNGNGSSSLTTSWNGNVSSVLQTRIRALEEERRHMSTKREQLEQALSAAEQRLEAEDAIKQDLEAQVQELTTLNEDTLHQLELSLDKEQRSSRIVLDLEQQLDGREYGSSRRAGNGEELQHYRSKIASLESQLANLQRSGDVSPISTNINGYHHHPSSHPGNLPSPPPSAPLPPLPLSANPTYQQHLLAQDYETRIRTIEKHLYAEKQLTQTLEEALVDLETQNNRTRIDADAWKRKCRELEEEASGLRRERGTMRNSLQAVEEERDRRIRAEQARRQLEERMEALGRRKKGRSLNCF